MNCKLTSITLKKGLAVSAYSKKSSTLENTILLQVASWNNDGVIQIYGCKCSFKIKTRLTKKHLSNILHHIYAIHGCNCSSKKYSTHWKMGGRNYFREIKKTCTLKKIFHAFKQEYFFRNYHKYFAAFSYQLLLH